jgi:hypothetical protein
MIGTKKKPIVKRDIDWLWDAINSNEDYQAIYIGEDYAIATDGYRLHQIGELPDKLEGIPLDYIKNLINSDKISTFCINPKFLIDALSGFIPSENGCVEISLVSQDDLQGVLVCDTSDKRAFVMCMEREK